MADIHDRTGAGGPLPVRKSRDLLDRLLRGRKPMRNGWFAEQLQPLERKRQVRAALVVGDGVNFVHDHRLDIAQNLAALLR